MIFAVLPIYDEAPNIVATLSAIRAALLGLPLCIVAVDDGSRDESAAILDGLAADDLVVVTHGVNMNIGAVFTSGILQVLGLSHDDNDVLVVMECDQTSDASVLRAMVARIQQQGDDICVASRYASGGAYRGFPPLRRLYSEASNRLMRALFPLPGSIRDYTIFYRAYRVGLLRRAVALSGPGGLLHSRGFAANAELLIKLSRLAGRMHEVPLVYDYGRKRGASKLPPARTILQYGSLYLQLRDLERRLDRRPR